MYLRAKKRIKDGKEHRYWSIVESCRNLDGRVVQRQVLYLGEINDSQKTAWCRTIEVLQVDSSAKQMALFPADRPAPELECEVVQVKLNELRVHHPRQWGACWLALTLWEQLELDRFWRDRLPASRQGFPLAYEVMPGNTSDKTTLKDFLAQIEAQYGRSDRVWIMDRAIPTEETLEQMRTGDSPVHYLVGTPKGRLSKFEKKFLTLPWQR